MNPSYLFLSYVVHEECRKQKTSTLKTPHRYTYRFSYFVFRSPNAADLILFLTAVFDLQHCIFSNGPAPLTAVTVNQNLKIVHLQVNIDADHYQVDKHKAKGRTLLATIVLITFVPNYCNLIECRLIQNVMIVY